MRGMEERPEQRPEGALIAAALKRSRMSQRQAAAKADISENRFRAIVHGYQTVSAGTYAPVRGPAETVARIAQAAGVTPEQLEEAGRPDAAEELRALLPHVRLHGVTLTAPSPVEESLKEKLARAHDLIAEGTRLLEELRRENDKER